MHNYKNVMGPVPIRMALVTLIVASLLLATPALSLANNHNENNDNGQGRAYGRMMVMPPIMFILSQWEERHGWLPPGLARLLERYEDHYGPIDDDDDDTDDDEDAEPELENVEETIEDTSATLHMEFSEDVQARLFVGTETGFANNDEGVIRISHTDYESEHEFELNDLDEETEYFYRVRYRDEDGNAVMSDELSFTTEATDDTDEEDTTDPVLESQEVTAGTSTADFEFTFDEPAQVRLFVSEVDGFNTNDDDVLIFNETEFLTEQTITVDELTPETEYFYRVRYRDEAGNTNLSEQMSFTTDEEAETDTTGPVISDVAGEAGTTTITGTFTTDEPATAAIYTATVSGFDLDDAEVIVTEDNTLKTEHELTITGLASSTTYYHVILVEDEAGNTTQSDEFTFGTD